MRVVKLSGLWDKVKKLILKIMTDTIFLNVILRPVFFKKHFLLGKQSWIFEMYHVLLQKRCFSQSALPKDFLEEDILRTHPISS